MEKEKDSEPKATWVIPLKEYLDAGYVRITITRTKEVEYTMRRTGRDFAISFSKANSRNYLSCPKRLKKNDKGNESGKG